MILKWLGCCDEVNSICSPLAKHFDITLFIYTRVYDNGNYWTLTNRGDWVQHFFQAKYVNPNPLNKKIEAGRYIDLSQLNVPDVQIKDARESFDADNWMNIVETFHGYYEVFAFAGHRNHSYILNNYINNFDVFEHFILYFKEKAKKLIQYADEHQIMQQGIIIPAQDHEQQLHLNNIRRREDFYRETPVKHYNLSVNNKEISIPNGEYQCLKLISSGKNIKAIAAQLGLTPRTVGYYLNNLKTRVGCYSRHNLIDIFRDVKDMNTNLKRA